MAEEWFVPSGVMPMSGGLINENDEDEWFVPGLGLINEDQAAAAAADHTPRHYPRGMPRGLLRGVA